MNELKFPLKVFKKANGNYVLMVEHHTGYDRTYTDPTRKFANWIRRQSSDIITEFRSVPYYVPTVDHNDWRGWWSYTNFVAYDVPANIFMLIKLSWTYTVKEITDSVTASGLPADTHSFLQERYQRPSDVAMKRVRDKKRVKLLKVDD